jgi:hypothetical protein
MHAWDPVTIVGAIKKHQASQDCDRARRSQRKTYGNGESAGVAVVGIFFSTLLFGGGKGKQQR